LTKFNTLAQFTGCQSEVDAILTSHIDLPCATHAPHGIHVGCTDYTKIQKLYHNLQDHLCGQAFLRYSSGHDYCDSCHGESAIYMVECLRLSLAQNRDCYIACISTGWCGAYHMTSCTCSSSWTIAALSTRLIFPATLTM
jgi:hypothetical protein